MPLVGLSSARDASMRAKSEACLPSVAVRCCSVSAVVCLVKRAPVGPCTQRADLKASWRGSVCSCVCAWRHDRRKELREGFPSAVINGIPLSLTLSGISPVRFHCVQRATGTTADSGERATRAVMPCAVRLNKGHVLGCNEQARTMSRVIEPLRAVSLCHSAVQTSCACCVRVSQVSLHIDSVE